jgi:ubiquinone/menaquinone biosynthesis C-methylase UbiE/acyl carrier protein
LVTLASQLPEGSYHVSSFSANTQAEIRRLDAQVDLFWPSERELIVRYGLKDGMDYLDCGCGPGRLIELLKDSFPALRCTGLEMDPILVEAAMMKLRNRGFSDCRVIEGTVEHPNLPEQSFNFITMRLVLEHVPDPVAAIQSLRRLLRPGGRLFLISNDFENHTRTWPPVPELDQLYEAYCTSRRRDHGDPCIGRRVPRLLATAGLSVVAQEIEVAHNAIVGDEPFLKAEGVGIPAQLVSSGFLEQSVFEKMIRSWKAMLTHPDHCITRQLCIAVGELRSGGAIVASVVPVPTTAAVGVGAPDAEETDFYPPGTELEQNLAALWCSVMDLKRVSIRSNFFDLGGDSLMLEQVHTQLREKLGYEEQITTLFQYPTIAMLAEYLKRKSTAPLRVESVSVEPGDRPAAVPAPDLQEQARRRRDALARRKSSGGN